MKTTNWSGYKPVSKEEQKLFNKLIGDDVKVEALLISSKKEEKFTEYIFLYNHPESGISSLVSFYCKLENNEIKEFSRTQLTEKMILKNVKKSEVLEKIPLVKSIAQTIKHSLENNPTHLIKYSQEHYKLDNEGSFAAICKGESYYYILTAHHCIDNKKNVLKHCSEDQTEKYDLVLDQICNSVNEEMRKNGLDVGLYRINLKEQDKDQRYDVFKKSNFYRNRYPLTGYSDPDKTEKTMSFHDNKSVTFEKYYNNSSFEYYNSFFVKTIGDDKKFNLGNSGGLVYENGKLTGVISGFNDGNQKSGRIACGNNSNPNTISKSEECIRTILDKNKIKLT